MSMSEFEGQQEIKPDGDGGSANHPLFPADFSQEDVEFAQELNALFVPEQEEVPPLFVQTLLDSDDARLQSADNSLEYKTRARVFRRLNLKQRLFRTRSTPLSRALLPSWAYPSFSQPFIVFVFSCLVVVVITMALTGPSFASGLNYLWTGAHSGVLQVKTFPAIFPSSDASPSQSQAKQHSGTASGSAATSADADRQLTIARAQQMLSFKPAYPLYIPDRYGQRNYYLYNGDASWADGPIFVLDYTYSLPGVAPAHITICEFKPQGQVLQVAQDDAAHQIRIVHGGTDNTVVYVDGQWTSTNNSSYVWDYNKRSEIVFESGGAEIWIVGDQRDGIGRDELLKIAGSLTAYDASQLRSGDHVTQSDESTPDIFADDVIYLNNPDNPAGPSFRLVGTSSDAAAAAAHRVQKSQMP